jgi:hypothetical protein
LDDLLDDESDEEESDVLVNQVFDELGLELNEQVSNFFKHTYPTLSPFLYHLNEWSFVRVQSTNKTIFCLVSGYSQ